MLEEVADLLVAAELVECGDSGVDGCARRQVIGSRDVEQVAGLLDDDEAVAGAERRGQLRRHRRHAVAAEHDLLAGLQLFESPRHEPQRTRRGSRA